MDRLVGVRGDLYEQLIHDPAGNLLEQNESTTTGKAANVRGNRLTMQGDCFYEYDEYGNLIEERRGKDQKLVTRYTYNCEHRLTSVTKPDGSTWHYEYDAFGRRIAKTNGLTRTEFLWQGDRLIAEETGDQYRTYVYEPDTFKPLALVDGYGPEQSSIYYYHLDHLGTPQELTNARGDLVWSVTYRAYGNVVRALVQEIDNPIRFQGQYHDTETGLHYNRHRYYNPNTGRFITPDPIGLAGGLNNYQYVPNPTGWVDPLGLASAPANCPGNASLEMHSAEPVPITDPARLLAPPKGADPWMPNTPIVGDVVGNEGMTVYRAHGAGRATGGWVTLDPPSNQGYVRKELAVHPDWNDATHYSEIKLAPRTRYQAGVAGPQDFPGGDGGGYQIQVLNFKDIMHQKVISTHHLPSE